MPLPAYAKIDGIKGSCTVKGREGTVQVLALDHDVTIPVDPKDSTATGAREHGAVELTADIDKAYVNMMKACCTSTAISSIELDFYEIGDDGKQKMYFKLKLDKARVTSVRTWFPNVDDKVTDKYKHMVTYGLRYEKITWTFSDGNIEYADAWKEPAT